MRSRDVKSWVQSGAGSEGGATESPYASDDDLRPSAMEGGAALNGMATGSSSRNGVMAGLPDPSQDWGAFLDVLSTRLRTPKTRMRLELLREALPVIVDEATSDEEQRVQLARVLLSTFDRYADKESRTAAQDIIARLILSDKDTASSAKWTITRSAVQWLSEEAETTCQLTKDGIPRTAASRRANLAQWAFVLFAAHARLCALSCVKHDESPYCKALAQLLARIYNAVVIDADNYPRIAQSVIVVARRCVRRAHDAIPSLFTTLNGLQGYSHVPLLGLVIDVSLRLRVGKEPAKGASDGQGWKCVAEAKDSILATYTGQVVSSKTPVPQHVRTALHDFIATQVTQENVDKSVRPVLEKMMLRSPEIAMPVAESLFSSYAHDTAPFITALQGPLSSASKSSSATTRQHSVNLFTVLAKKCLDVKTLEKTAQDLVANVKSGKVASAEQRAANYEMLAAIRPAEGCSAAIVAGIASVLAKEAQESSMRSAMHAVTTHLQWCLAHDVDAGSAVAQALTKEMENVKAPLRKIVCLDVGEVMWQDLPSNSATHTFVKALLKPWDANLKNASSNTLTSPAGPLEGYIAAAVLLGRSSSWQLAEADSFVASNAILKSLSAVSPKPSFLLNEKVVRKATSLEEQTWLLRALQAFLVVSQEATASDGVQSAASSALVHVAFHSTHSTARRAVADVLGHVAITRPLLACALLETGLLQWLSEREAERATPATEENARAPSDHCTTLRRLLLSVCTVSDTTRAETERHDILTRLFLFAHHPELGANQRQCFAELCQAAKVDPGVFVDTRLYSLYPSVRSALSTTQMHSAALVGLSSLVALRPDESAMLVMKDVRASLDPAQFTALTNDDIGMWKIGPEALYVDVLAKKEDKKEDRNRKNFAIEQWEAELRESIARKRAAENKTLTKEQQKAVDAQRGLEREVRERVANLQANTTNALAMISSMVEARARTAIDGNMSALVHRVLALLAIPQAQALMLNELVGVLQSLSSCCTERMGDYAAAVRVTMMRTIDDALIDNDFKAESLKDATLRILYRLRFLCEQTPLDLASMSFLEPLLTKLVVLGGLGTTVDESDTIEEQLRLTLDIITFHGSACRDPRFPRMAFVDDLVIIVATQAQLAKDAVASLRTLGDAIKTNATPQEIQHLLTHALAEEVYVRTGTLQALQPLDLTEIEFCVELWIACHDEDEENARLANKAWEDNGLDVPTDYAPVLLPYLEHAHAFVRSATSRSLATAAEVHPETRVDLVDALIQLYNAKNEVLEPQYDRFGMVIEESLNREDPWECRSAIASAFLALSNNFPAAESLLPFFDFLVRKEGLGDRHEAVRRAMLQAATAIVDIHGKAKVSELITMFENALENPTNSGNDDVTEAIIILFGRLAKHLDAGDKRIAHVIQRLMEALKTPSELVQVAVADCLAPLAPSISADVPTLFDTLFTQLLHSPRYAERRGAAYGLAGLIKGRGISSIAEFGVMSRLAMAVDDKKDTSARQGAMMAYETMIATLQRLFEPYIPQIVPQLLACFGDQSTEVREATQETSRVIMQNISGYGVRLIMPLLLQGLDEKQWRIKRGAIELLGAMAYCAPKQLSHFLPTIIPHLSEPIKDSHNQVRQAAERALKGFGDVINNPEVKQLVPVIMRALVDPSLKTPAAQKAILKQKWIHVLDGPSLALLIPVIDRGLRERGAQIQKDAARIVGNLASLTDSKDFVPYLESLVPLLRTVLVSPVPDARATAAKSLGTLVERLGEIHFISLVPSLLDILKSDLSSVDRQGSAQGLAEVLAGLGVERMEALLPDIINNAQASKRATVRESHVLLLIYLPATFGLRFSPYLGRIIPPILGGIADDSDSVREASMRAGRMIIANYSNRAVDLLLPELESGLFDESWRIRLSSIQLISDLLFRLSGITGTNEVENAEEDEEGGAEQNIVAGNSIQKALAESLGVERRNKILAAFYLLRQDSVINVRQAAIQTWKAIVTNTPKLAREILPILVDLITQLLAQGVESRETAGRALGELVSKLGERILGESIPMLQSKTDDDDESLRAGVCTAVTEILNNSTEHQLQDHQDSLIAIVKKGLVDASSEVREAAAEAFDALQEHVGAYAIDEIVPGLLETLVKEDEDDEEDEEDQADEEEETDTDEEEGKEEDTDSDAESEDFVDDSEQGRALSALQEIMKGSADSVFPVLVPTLIEQPMSAFNASALVTLGSLAGNALYRRLSPILDAFATAIDTQEDEDLRESLEASLSTLMSCIFEYDGVYQLMTVLLGWSASIDSAKMRARGCRYFALFCNVKYEDADLGTYGIDWVRRLVSLFDDRNDEVVDAAVAGMEALIKTVPKEDLENITVPLHRTLEDTGSAGRVLPGFTRPKGAAPLGAVFLAGLMNGTAEQREMGAYGLADIVERSSADSIKPMVVSMIGPLIRTCGDRHMPQVKTAILYALTTMLNFPQHCKPFFPQLQRSFQKAVADISSNKVRTQAGLGLGRLMAHQARVDAVVAELLAQIEPGNAGPASDVSFEVNDMAISAARALARVLEKAPADNVGASTRASLLKLLQGVVANKGAHESFKVAIADVLGSYLVLGGTEKDVAALVDNSIARVDDGACDAAFSSLCVLDMLTKAPEKLWATLEHPRKIARLVGGWVSDGPAIARPARESRDILRSRAPWNQDDGVHDVLG